LFALDYRAIGQRILTAMCLAIIMLLGTTAACSNDLVAFCEETTTDLCEQCWACAETDAEASEMCGLLAETDKEGCALILTKVCTSDDGAYNTETGRACREQIGKLSCDELRSSGKPNVCGRLF